MLRKTPIVSIEARFTRARKLSPEETEALRLSPRKRYYEIDGQVYWARDAGRRPPVVKKSLNLT